MAVTSLFLYSLFAVLFLGALLNPIVGVLGYLTVYMLYNPDVWWGAAVAKHLTRPSFVAVFFLAIGCLLHKDKLEWNISRREKELYLFLGAIWLASLAFGVEVHEQSWMYLEKMTKLFVFIFIFLRVVHSLNRYKLVIWAFILGGLFLGWQAHVIGRFTADGRLDNLGGIDFSEANGFAAFLAMGTTLLGVQIFRASLWKKVLYVFGIAPMLNAIIMTQSRAVLLGVLMATPYVLIRAPSEKRKQIYIAVTLGIVLFFMLADTKFLTRMRTIQSNMGPDVEYTEEESINRFDFWKTSLEIFKDHPLGIGVKNFEKLVPYYDPRNPGRDAHNTYVLCYSEIGILGIAVFLIIIAETVIQIRRIHIMAMSTPHKEEIELHVFGLSTVLIIYLLGYMVTHSILYTEILWILLAMPICLENATKKLFQENQTTEDEGHSLKYS